MNLLNGIAKRRFLVAAAAFATGVGAVGVMAPQAQATSAYGCGWPRVCFYKTQASWNADSPTASYQDMGYWQTLGTSSKGSYGVYNSRNDDCALLEFSDGEQYRLKPNKFFQTSFIGTVTKIKIMDSPTC
ncbi:hypothetical protein [Yinghuangia soli]|uniref:Peptidase inhibitor family I36 n=1 Tax=Yinghuangia soli TaxID=2908204 RepID=A0AA41TZC8_9ACTN|nr:hypothetical protein [Yinghuangia soli]MCF2527145.1 hypothetical protein [Yinghuangia soli]